MMRSVSDDSLYYYVETREIIYEPVNLKEVGYN